MSRRTTGEVTERLWADGTTTTFGARLYAYGRRHRLVFGTDRQGWNRTRAEIELESIQQQVVRGTWLPPERKSSTVRREAEHVDGRRRFEAFARAVVEAKRSHGLDEDTMADVEWKLGYLVGHFGRMELADIDVAGVDRFRDDLAGRARVIREATARDRPPMETVRRRDGKSYERRRRPLSNTSINGMLALLGQILQRGGGLRLHRPQPGEGGDAEGAVPADGEAGADVPGGGRAAIAARRAAPSSSPAVRRTWAMLAAQAGRDPHWIADQIGHTSAAFTLQVYQQTRNRRLTSGERQAVWDLMRFADEPPECPFTRQATRTPEKDFGPINGPMDDLSL
ncbi:MAG TPA: hypothetical protein VMU32_00695 [Solirubrobacteraceae bacterium]|nr:hypothetical protein [Solirubrobacteraceae bacterium]